MTKLQYYRLRQGLSQREVGELLHITPTVVSQIERGYRRPWPKVRRELAALLNVPESELFGPDGSCLETAEDVIIMPIRR